MCKAPPLKATVHMRAVSNLAKILQKTRKRLKTVLDLAYTLQKKIIKRTNDTLTSGYKGANADERSNWLIEIMGQLLYFQFAYLKVVIVILSP